MANQRPKGGVGVWIMLILPEMIILEKQKTSRSRFVVHLDRIYFFKIMEKKKQHFRGCFGFFFYIENLKF